MEEDSEVTMARFLHGLNHAISDIVELHNHVALEDLLHHAIKVEQKGTTKEKHYFFKLIILEGQIEEGGRCIFQKIHN